MKIRAGDNVVVITGKDKGKTGAVLRVLPNTSRVVVAGINMRTKHVKATPQRAGQKMEYEASVHVSNIMLVDPKNKKRTRIGFSEDAKGKKQRIAKNSGDVLPAKKAGATTVKADPKKKDAKTEMKEERKKKEAQRSGATKEAEEQPTPAEGKKPFWKKMLNFGGDAAADAELDQPTHMQEDHSIPKESKPSRSQSSSRGS